MGELIKLDLSNLPRNCKGIDWKESIGYRIPINIETINRYIDIIGFNKENNKLVVKHNNSVHEISSSNLLAGKIGKMIGIRKFQKSLYNIGDSIKQESKSFKVVGKQLVSNNGIYKWKYLLECNKCKQLSNWRRQCDISGGVVGCKCCSGKKVVAGINDIATIAPWMNKFFPKGVEQSQKYTVGTSKKVTLICPNCGTKISRKGIIKNVYKNGYLPCPSCGDGFSYPEKFMANVLDQLKVKYKREYSPEWLGYRRFDFYIPDLSLIIEMDGGLGHGIRCIGYDIDAKKSKEIDDIKDRLAYEHGIKVIRINSIDSSRDWLKENIKDALNDYFDFSSVDWDISNEISHKGIVREVCDYYNNHPDIKRYELANKFNISPTTAGDYLSRGTEMGWCKYIKRFHKSIVPIKVYKKDTMEYLGIYTSRKDLVENSKKDFGVSLKDNGIQKVLYGETEKYKGFYFERVLD